MKVKADYYYSEEHEWVRVEGDLAYIGITDYAQHHLGNIVFVELPENESEFAAGEVIGVIESVKAVADMHTPVSGTVTAINEELEDSPELLNEDPYGHYIAVLKMTNPEELKALMNSEQYAAFCEQQEE